MNSDCNCFTLKECMSRNQYSIGTDETDGRFADVSIWECTNCNTLWLHYFLEYHWHRNSGRWFRGLITAEVVQTIKADEAIDYFNSLDWYFRGGGFFETKGEKREKSIKSYDLM